MALNQIERTKIMINITDIKKLGVYLINRGDLLTAIEKKRKLVVEFSGGLGNQILSAAVYFYYERLGYLVYADLTYFEKPHKIALPGAGVSHWKWELDGFGMEQSRFKDLSSLRGRGPLSLRIPFVPDGEVKAVMAFRALHQEEVRKLFMPREQMNPYGSEKYICAHIRRGDYLNVASHMVSDKEFTNILLKFEGLVDGCVIVSDSPVDVSPFQMVRKAFKDKLSILENESVHMTHSVMRNADVLVCSNSQYSLSAGLLSKNLVLIPKKWYGPGLSSLEKTITDMSDFICVQNY